MSARIALALILAAAAVPGRAEVSAFAANEVLSAGVKDRLRLIRSTLKDGTDGARRHSAAVTAAFKGAADWAAATEAYYARKTDLLARAEALDARFDALIARNAPERAEETAKRLEEAGKHESVLRSDFEFYMKLPKLADAPEPQRQAAQAAMRLLGATGDYPVALAYFLDKTPNREPFAPLPPGVMSIRHQ